MAEHVEPSAVSPELDAHLREIVIPAFQRDCFSPESLSYSELDRRLAYGFHFGPKHAVVWRRYLLNMKSFLKSCVRFNSIGTGPGSEIVGILEASSVPLDRQIEIVCLERELEWQNIFENVIGAYIERTGRDVVWTYTDDPKYLLEGAPVVGSCVLSELGRERRLTSFRKTIMAQVGAVKGRFLDFPSFPRDDGTHYIEDLIPCHDVVKIYEKEWNVQQELNEEMNSCKPCHCRVLQGKEPGMRMHLVRFQ